VNDETNLGFAPLAKATPDFSWFPKELWVEVLIVTAQSKNRKGIF